MANNTLKTRIIICNGTTSEWGNSDKVLLKGEIGIEFPESGAPKFKVGDGVNAWTSLQYCVLTPAEVEALIAAANHSHTNKTILDAVEVALTTAMQTKYETAYTHSQAAHAPAEAQENVIETVKVNGVSQTVTDKAVDIEVPTKVSDLSNDTGFITAAEDKNTKYNVLFNMMSGQENYADVELRGDDGSSAGNIKFTGEGAATISVSENQEIVVSVDEYDDTELAGKVATNTAAIATLNGEGEGSVTKAIDDAFNDFATKVTDDGVVNSYKELIDYAAEHGEEFTELVGTVSDIDTAVKELDAKVGDLPEGTTATTVVEYIDDKVGAVDFSEAIAAAKSEAISTAAADATTKANTAEQNAKDYADGLASNYATAAQGARADKAVTKVSLGGTEVPKNADGEVDITSVSTDLLVNGTNVLVLDGGSATE